MAKYTFNFDANFGGILRPYVFRSDFPGTGAVNQYFAGKVFGKAFGGAQPNTQPMNVGVNDLYGRPVFCDLILQRNDKDTDRVEMVNALVTVDQTKKIVRTDLSGRNGSVLEYVAMPSAKISIEGLLISSEVDVYPKEQTEALIRMLNENQTLEVLSEYLSMCNIYNLVVESYSLKQEPSKQGEQKLKISAIADELLELVIE